MASVRFGLNVWVSFPKLMFGCRLKGISGFRADVTNQGTYEVSRD